MFSSILNSMPVKKDLIIETDDIERVVHIDEQDNFNMIDETFITTTGAYVTMDPCMTVSFLNELNGNGKWRIQPLTYKLCQMMVTIYGKNIVDHIIDIEKFNTFIDTVKRCDITIVEVSDIINYTFPCDVDTLVEFRIGDKVDRESVVLNCPPIFTSYPIHYKGEIYKTSKSSLLLISEGYKNFVEEIPKVNYERYYIAKKGVREMVTDTMNMYDITALINNPSLSSYIKLYKNIQWTDNVNTRIVNEISDDNVILHICDGDNVIVNLLVLQTREISVINRKIKGSFRMFATTPINTFYIGELDILGEKCEMRITKSEEKWKYTIPMVGKFTFYTDSKVIKAIIENCIQAPEYKAIKVIHKILETKGNVKKTLICKEGIVLSTFLKCCGGDLDRENIIMILRHHAFEVTDKVIKIELDELQSVIVEGLRNKTINSKSYFSYIKQKPVPIKYTIKGNPDKEDIIDDDVIEEIVSELTTVDKKLINYNLI